MQRRNERFVERLPLVLNQRWYAFAITTILCVAALLLREAAAPFLRTGYPFVSFFPAVIIASFLFGVGPGIYAALLCGAAAWYVFIPPYLTFTINPGVVVALLFYTGVVVVDITLIHWMQRANYNLGVERERSRALADNHTLLFRELQHRVSNNIQVVAGLLTLQRRSITDEAARRALDEASTRLALVGKISRSLYDPAGQGQTIRAFLDMLGSELLEASGRGDIALSVEASGDLLLEPDVTIPMALIFAEAVSNALEHGFADRQGGRIVIRLVTQDNGGLSLAVVDDGPGVASGFDPNASASLGLKIATTLAKQLGGRFTMKNAPSGGGMALLDIPARTAC